MKQVAHAFLGPVLASYFVISGMSALGQEKADALLDPREAEEGFFSLFNGKNLDGWRVRGANKDAFRVENGVLIVTGAPDGDWLFTTEEYDDFVLRLEFRLVENKPGAECNSGVAIRAPQEGDPAYAGMEIQVLRPDWETPWQRAGAIYHVVPPKVQAQKKIGEWNSMEIRCEGVRIRTMLNGQELYDIRTTDYAVKEDWRLPLTDRPLKGHIGIQDHLDRVEFRNIRIKPLPAPVEPAQNGEPQRGDP